MDHNTAAHETSETSQAHLADGYHQMAADEGREAEAEEWTEQVLFDLE